MGIKRVAVAKFPAAESATNRIPPRFLKKKSNGKQWSDGTTTIFFFSFRFVLLSFCLTAIESSSRDSVKAPSYVNYPSDWRHSQNPPQPINAEIQIYCRCNYQLNQTILTRWNGSRLRSDGGIFWTAIQFGWKWIGSNRMKKKAQKESSTNTQTIGFIDWWRLKKKKK